MENARDLRLRSDYTHLRELAHGSGGSLEIESAQGHPPDRYILVYRCRTIECLQHDKPVYRALQRVEIALPARYPAPYAAPVVKMLTPIFHPHVYSNLMVCMGEWQTSEYLDDFAVRLGALLQFRKEFFDVRDPANEEAIDWARKHLILFPTDNCTFHGDDLEQLAAIAATSSAPGFTPLELLRNDPTASGGLQTDPMASPSANDNALQGDAAAGESGTLPPAKPKEASIMWRELTD